MCCVQSIRGFLSRLVIGFGQMKSISSKAWFDPWNQTMSKPIEDLLPDKPNARLRIYARSTKEIQKCKGWLNVGQTTLKDVNIRIKQSQGVAQVKHLLEVDELAEWANGSAFRDSAIRDAPLDDAVRFLDTEWWPFGWSQVAALVVQMSYIRFKSSYFIMWRLASDVLELFGPRYRLTTTENLLNALVLRRSWVRFSSWAAARQSWFHSLMLPASWSLEITSFLKRF